MIWTVIPSFPRYEIDEDGRVRHTKRRRLRKIHWAKGYAKIGLRTDKCKPNRAKTVFLHRVIWEAFHGRIPSGMQINHIDGNKANNALANLEIVTAAENMQHAKRYGLLYARGPRGERAGKSRLTEALVIEMREVARRWPLNYEAVARKLSVRSSTIKRAISGKSWSHLSTPPASTSTLPAAGEHTLGRSKPAKGHFTPFARRN